MTLIAFQLELLQHADTSQQCDTAAGNDPFFNGGSCGGERIVDQILAFLHLSFSVSTDADLSHTTGQLGETLLQLLAIVFAVGLGDFLADHRSSAFDLGLLATTLNHRGVLGIDANLLRGAEVTQLDVLQLGAQVFEDRLAAGEDGDVFEHRLATITVTGSLDRTNFQDATHLVHDERRQGFPFDVLGDDEQREARL